LEDLCVCWNRLIWEKHVAWFEEQRAVDASRWAT
jgi:hypothetical protein